MNDVNNEDPISKLRGKLESLEVEHKRLDDLIEQMLMQLNFGFEQLKQVDQHCQMQKSFVEKMKEQELQVDASCNELLRELLELHQKLMCEQLILNERFMQLRRDHQKVFMEMRRLGAAFEAASDDTTPQCEACQRAASDDTTPHVECVVGIYYEGKNE